MFTIDRSSPILIYIQIEQLIERLISDQLLAAHEILPSAVALAEQLKVSPLTVQKAYRHMQERGVIYSVAGKGTFVAETRDRSFVAVVVHDQELLESPHLTQTPLLLRAMREELIARGHRPRMLIDMNPRVLHPSPTGEEVMDALRTGRVSGILLMAHYGAEKLFALADERGIPVVGYGVPMPKGHTSVTAENNEMLRMSLEHLKSKGVREVGVLRLDWKNSPAQLAEWVRDIMQTIHHHGLESRLEWLVGVPESNEWASYHAFNHLCDSADRPRGLVIFDEFLGRGVLMAARSRGISVPGDMEMVVASYEDSTSTFPKSWSRCEVNLWECGKKAVELLCDRMEGHGRVGEVRLPFTWHAGVEGFDEPAAAGFRNGRTIMADAESVRTGKGGASISTNTFRPMVGRTFSKESVR